MQRKRTFLFFLLMALLATSTHASIIKKPPVKSTDVAYKDLVCSEQDRAYIFEIISTMGENSKLSLFLKQSHLKEIGAQINHVHPLKFISTIFTNPHLRSCMFIIWDDYFKRTNLMDGLGPSLSREAEKGKLNQYLAEFATEIGVPLENMRHYFESQDWENLVLYLIHT